MGLIREEYSLRVCGKPDENELAITLRKWENDKEIFSRDYNIKQVNGLANRVIINSKIPITCREENGEVFCTVGDISVALPRVCVRKEINGGVETVCGLDNIRWGDRVLAGNILIEAEKLKKGVIDFMARHNVTFVLDYTMEEDTLGRAKCYGKSGDCFIELNARACRTPKELTGTFMHEFAHVREWIAREEKGLEPISEKTGGWEKREGKLVPVGHETRAVKFKERILKVAD